MAQQLSLSLGITIGALLLESSQMIHGTAHITRADFPWAFLGVALVSASSVLMFGSLPENAGMHLAGGARKKASQKRSRREGLIAYPPRKPIAST